MRSSGRRGDGGELGFVLFCPEYSRVIPGVTNCSVVRSYFRIGTTPRLGFGSLLLQSWLVDTLVAIHWRV